MWWTKSRRAQNVDDYETWIFGGVVPTLNVFDNASDTRATILIIDGTRVNDVRVYEDGIVPTVISRYGTGGGNVPMIFEPGSLTRNAGSKPNENVAPTLRASMGDNQPAVVYPIDDARELEKHQNGTGIGEDGAPAYTLDRQQAPAVATEQTVRRLTPVECERLQGFPDDWTSGQADSSRYKQMGNAVAVPVVEWIVGRLVAQLDE
jgi:site-specific DNA-cytosine methylase